MSSSRDDLNRKMNNNNKHDSLNVVLPPDSSSGNGDDRNNHINNNNNNKNSWDNSVISTQHQQQPQPPRPWRWWTYASAGVALLLVIGIVSVAIALIVSRSSVESPTSTDPIQQAPSDPPSTAPDSSPQPMWTSPYLNCGTRSKKQMDYIGTINITRNGTQCQAWTQQFPHEHSTTPENYPEVNLDHNYCRNPDGDQAAWCFTVDPDTIWDFCDIPDCGYCGNESTNTTCDSPCTSNEECPSDQRCIMNAACGTPPPMLGDSSTFPPLKLQEFCGTPGLVQQKDYRGTLNMTRSGHACQPWTAQIPHQHSRTPENYPDSGIGDHNYCRNPDGEPSAWCYTTEDLARWELCDVPNCGYCGVNFEDAEAACGSTCYTNDDCEEEHHSCIQDTLCGVLLGVGAPEEQLDCGTLSVRQIDYRGTINVTTGGIPCQYWDAQRPHAHDRTSDNYPSAGLEENNYCRNPDADDRAWCYTIDEEQRWQYCDIPACPEQN